MNRANRMGLTIGIMFSALHVVWFLLVVLGLAQVFINWVIHMHMVNSNVTIINFNILNAIVLLAAVFALGYAVGFVGTALYEKLGITKSKYR